MPNQPSVTKSRKSLKQDVFDHPDFYQIYDLLSEEHKLIRYSIREFVKKEISPFIEHWAQEAHFPYEIVKKFGEIGAFGPTVPAEYGGGGLDYISYGLIMQEIERGDSGMRSTASVQGSLVMYPIYKFGSEEQRKKELQLRSIQPNCSCVTAEASKTSLKPGESGTIRITFNPQERSGTQNKAISFYSNDPKNPVQRLTFTAYIQ